MFDVKCHILITYISLKNCFRPLHVQLLRNVYRYYNRLIYYRLLLVILINIIYN